jgi:hypothetical protein
MPAGMSVNTWRSNGWRSPRLVPVRLTLSSRCMLRSSSNLKVVCQTGGEMNVRVVKAFIVGLALIIAMPSLASAQSTSQKLFDQFRRETGQYHPTDPRHPTNRARVNRNRQQQLQQQKQRTRQRYRPPPPSRNRRPASVRRARKSPPGSTRKRQRIPGRNAKAANMAVPIRAGQAVSPPTDPGRAGLGQHDAARASRAKASTVSRCAV